jgi:hypothetical protein
MCISFAGGLNLAHGVHLLLTVAFGKVERGRHEQLA